MNRNVHNIIANLDGIELLETENELQSLDKSVSELLTSENPEAGIGALLSVFERFPIQDGFGVFWNIVHGLESLSSYELPLVESVERQPSLFGLLMINSLINGGIIEIEGHDLLNVLKGVAADKQELNEIRAEARDFVEFQERKKR